MKLTALLLLAGLSTAMAGQPQNAVVTVPVADVWSRPLAPGEKPADSLRETQVLMGESVIIHESSGPWVRIEAVEQPEFTHHNLWEGYPGWVLKNALGTTRVQNKVVRSRGDILTIASSNIGVPYVWGGMSRQSGFDCSGLVHIAYRGHTMQIPRDAYEQWMKAKPIKRSELKPDDLIFSAKADNPKKVTHVALYAGDDQIIEAPQMGMVVRKVSFKEKYGKPLDEVESGDHVGDRYVYFGTFLH